MSAPTVLLDLVTVQGQLIRVECPGKWEDELHDYINNARITRDWWSPSAIEGCKATFAGLMLDRVDMNQILGVMR